MKRTQTTGLFVSTLAMIGSLSAEVATSSESTYQQWLAKLATECAIESAKGGAKGLLGDKWNNFSGKYIPAVRTKSGEFKPGKLDIFDILRTTAICGANEGLEKVLAEDKKSDATIELSKEVSGYLLPLACANTAEYIAKKGADYRDFMKRLGFKWLIKSLEKQLFSKATELLPEGSVVKTVAAKLTLIKKLEQIAILFDADGQCLSSDKFFGKQFTNMVSNASTDGTVAMLPSLDTENRKECFSRIVSQLVPLLERGHVTSRMNAFFDKDQDADEPVAPKAN